MKTLILVLCFGLLLSPSVFSESGPCIFFATSFPAQDYSHMSDFYGQKCAGGSNTAILAEKTPKGEAAFQASIAKICDYEKEIVVFENKYLDYFTATCSYNGSKVYGYQSDIDTVYSNLER